MVRLTKAQRKDGERVDAWLKGEAFKENARAKPAIPDLTIEQVMDQFVPEGIDWGCKFYTPHLIAEHLWSALSWSWPQKILEPCAGIGGLIYPAYTTLNYSPLIEAYDLDQTAVEIGKKLFPRVDWHWGSPFHHPHLLWGQFDCVLMNPPFNTTWGWDNEVDDFVNGICKKSEHAFLMLAIHALQENGVALIVAPYNFISKIPKSMSRWFLDRVGDITDLGQLPGELRFTKINVHGWIIRRNGNFQPEQETVTELETTSQPAPLNLSDVQATVYYDVAPVTKGNQPEVSGDAYASAPEQLTMENLIPSRIEYDFINEISTEALWQGLDERSKIEVNARRPDKAFIASVKRFGIRNPIIVVRQTVEEKSVYRIRAGRKRLNAARKLGLPVVKVMWYSGSDIGEMGAAVLDIDDNSTRDPNPITEVEAILEVLNLTAIKGIPCDLKDIASLTGMSVQKIRKRLPLANLPKRVIDAVRAGEVSYNVAYDIAHSPAGMAEELVRFFDEKGGKLTAVDVDVAKQTGREIAASQLDWASILDQPKEQTAHILMRFYGESDLTPSGVHFEVLYASLNFESVASKAEEYKGQEGVVLISFKLEK